MKVALVHDWLNGMRGGEKILEVLAEIFPEAHVFTLIYEPEKISATINKLPVHTSFIQSLPGGRRYYRYYLPLFPKAVERFNLGGYDLVISTSHCVAKGVKVHPQAVHICYCLTPIRYVWDFSEEYFGARRYMIKPVLDYLKRWDLTTSRRPQFYFSISQNVANRVKRYYNRDSTVIYPPVDTDFFSSREEEGDYYLVVSALVPYKRIDIAVEAFTELKLPLVVIGSGTEYKRLRKKAGPNIKFLGWQEDKVIRDYYAGCRAFVFPGVEDFGITPLEAQSCGRPVIAYRKGGVLETVSERVPSGLFFDQQTKESLMETVLAMEDRKNDFDGDKIREHVLGFDRKIFKQRLSDEIQRVYNLYHHN